MPSKLACRRFTPRIPDTSRAIHRARYEPAAVGRERGSQDSLGVPFELAEQRAGPAVPNPNRAIECSCGDPFSIFAQRDRTNGRSAHALTGLSATLRIGTEKR